MEQIRSWLIPTREFYICGFNAFDDSNSVEKIIYNYELEPEKYSDIDNSWVEYANIKSAILSHYIVNDLNFYIAISKVEKFFLITLFVKEGSAIPTPDEETFVRINEYMSNQLITNEEIGVIYSQNKNKRVIVEKRNDGFFLCYLENVKINFWAILDFPKYSSEILKDYFYFECVKKCIFDTKENALANAKQELEEDMY